MRDRFVGVLFALSLVAVSAAGQPALVANLNTGPDSSSVGTFLSDAVEREGVLYFAAYDPQHGRELWRSDGTVAGTYRVTDLCPGPCTGITGPIFGVAGGHVLFGGSDGGDSFDLWRTDGRPDSEEPVADWCKGIGCQFEFPSWQVWADRLWVLSQNRIAGPALWTSDGTRQGTFRVGNLRRDFGIEIFLDNGFAARFAGIAPGGDGLLFHVNQGRHPWVYRTDGSIAGTRLLHQPALATADLRLQAEVVPAVLASGGAGEPHFFFDGSELWRSDGTAAGTTLVRNLLGFIPFPDIVSLRATASHGGEFDALFSDGTWMRSDGTFTGTRILGQPVFAASFARLGGEPFVVARDGLWAADGGAGSAHLALALDTERAVVAQAGDRLFVITRDQLTTTDGTAAGTHSVALPAGSAVDSLGVAAVGEEVLFTRGRRELWVAAADATASRVGELEAADGASMGRDQIVLGAQLLFFAEDDAANVSHLYRSDGTTAGTERIPTAPAGYSSGLVSFTPTPRRVFFNSLAGVGSTDGTAAGTQVVHGDLFLLEGLGVLGDRLLLSGISGASGPDCENSDGEPWVSDGSAARTRLVVDLNPFYEVVGRPLCEFEPLPSLPGPGVTLGSRVFFAANDYVHGRELFVSDGSRRGTRLVADIHRGTVRNLEPDAPIGPPQPARVGLGSGPTDLVKLGNKVLFVADDGRTGRELWVTDGTAKGTRRVADLAPGAESSRPRNLTVVDRVVYFFARVGGAERLFKSDGTSRGTTLVSALVRDGVPVLPGTELVASGNQVFFAGETRAAGVELWASGGSEATTRRVTDLWPGFRSSLPRDLTAVRNGVAFAAGDPVGGYEAYWSDGTRIVALGDIAPGRDASSPGPFTVLGEALLTGADDGVHGRELWSIPLDLD